MQFQIIHSELDGDGEERKTVSACKFLQFLIPEAVFALGSGAFIRGKSADYNVTQSMKMIKVERLHFGM